MQDETPFMIAVERVAAYLKQHSDVLAEESAASMTGARRADYIRQIELCAERMAATRTYAEFEATLSEAHRLGAYPFSDDVGAVAFTIPDDDQFVDWPEDRPEGALQ